MLTWWSVMGLASLNKKHGNPFHLLSFQYISTPSLSPMSRGSVLRPSTGWTAKATEITTGATRSLEYAPMLYFCPFVVRVPPDAPSKVTPAYLKCRWAPPEWLTPRARQPQHPAAPPRPASPRRHSPVERSIITAQEHKGVHWERHTAATFLPWHLTTLAVKHGGDKVVVLLS